MSIPEDGAEARADLVVTEADTAIALRSGDVPVLGTPRVLALCEEATVAVTAGTLEPHQTTVGASVELDHLSPTRVGATVSARAVLERVEGRTLTFRVLVTEDDRMVARATITRVVVDRERFAG